MLADEVTTLVHGAEETAQAKAAAEALFGGGDITTLSSATLAAALAEAGAVDVDPAGGIPGVVDLLTLTGLAASKGEARRTVSEGGVYLNNVRVEDVDHVPSSSDLIAGSWLVLRRGKKRFAGVRGERGCPAVTRHRPRFVSAPEGSVMFSESPGSGGEQDTSI